jgi:cytochrome c5
MAPWKHRNGTDRSSSFGVKVCDDGKSAYVCMACHDTGVAGAPKLGDKAAWAPRIGKGLDALVASASKGLNAMPPKGGYSGSDAEFHAAVEYIVNAAK